MTISPASFPAITVTVVRHTCRKIRTALRTNHIAGFVTMPSWEKINPFTWRKIVLCSVWKEVMIRGFIRSWQPVKIAAYLVRICLLPLPTLSVFSLKELKKFISLPPNLVSSDSYSKTYWKPCNNMPVVQILSEEYNLASMACTLKAKKCSV